MNIGTIIDAAATGDPERVALIVGDRAIVRGEVSGAPAGELFGAPHTGKRFKVMTIDIQTIVNGKMIKTYHLENWLGALQQLRTV